MKNISSLENCYGCGACTAVCPVNIIDMRQNADGFFEPFIDQQNRCTDCGLCLRVCSFANEGVSCGSDEPEAFAAWSNIVEERHKASSGGISSALMRHAFAEFGGNCRVVGVRYNPHTRRAEHFVAESFAEAADTFGSKYLQSFTQDGFQAIDLRDRNLRWVLTGTPCQMDSMRRLLKLRKAEDRFLLVDFFCHGVPSQLIWDKYLKETGISETADIAWRSKADNQKHPFAITATDGGSGIVESCSAQKDGDMFFRLFFSNNCLNKCCYKSCKFKSLSSGADIRIGDFWSKEYEDEIEGVSVAVGITERGQSALRGLSDDCTLIPVKPEKAVEGQMKSCLKENKTVRSLSLRMLRAGMPLKLVNLISRIARHL